MRTTRILGLCIAGAVAGVLVSAAVGSSSASPNLIKNGGGEVGGAVTDSSTVIPGIPSWTKTGGFTTVRYGATGGFPGAAVSTVIKGGKNLFSGGPENGISGAKQLVSVTGKAAAIDRGKVGAVLSGDLGGYASQRDSLTVTATFLNATDEKLGSVRIGPVTPGQRKDMTTLVLRSARASVPPKTRKVEVRVSAVRTDGSYNDGYADNLALTFTTGA